MRVFRLIFLFLLIACGVTFAQQNGTPRQRSPLAEILLSKGILTPDEMKQVEAATTPEQSELLLARILADKGVLTNAEFEQIAGKAPMNAQVSTPAPAPAPATENAQLKATPTVQVEPQPAAIISAIAPIRTLPLGGVSRDAAPPAIKANGVGITPYGAIKVTAIVDSSSPYGDDFPLPGFICDTGADGSPEFHIKARSTRLGVNFAWNDPNPKWSIYGKVEMDFEGNFNRSDNRNISSIRSSNPSLRLAWGRLDYAPNQKNIFSALFGQDWTPFGSSTIPGISKQHPWA